MAGEDGSFIGGPDGDREYNYEFEKWKTETGEWQESIDDSDITQAQHIVFKIENPDTGGVGYTTVTGPFDDWEVIEEILEDYWGEDGYDKAL